MPPAAATIDSAAMRGFCSSPSTSSRLNSKATTKKNSVIKASLIQPRNGRAASSEADPDADGQLPEGQKLMGPRGIGQDQGGDGKRQADGAARSLDAQKRRKRFRQPVDDFTGQPIESRISSSISIHADLIRSIGAATAVARGRSMRSAAPTAITTPCHPACCL